MQGGTFHTLVKTATAAGLIGLAVLHPTAFTKIIGRTVDTFRRAVTLA